MIPDFAIYGSYPTSLLISVLYLQVRPIEMRALRKFEENGKLQVEEGDLLTVIDGR